MDPLRCVYLISILFTFSLLQAVSSEGLEECHPAKSCGSCMRIDPRCSWCKDTSDTFISLRCDTKEELEQNGCSPADILTTESRVEIVQDLHVRDPTYDEATDELLEEAIPIEPQEVRISLRRGETQTIKAKVRQVADYPVDLYYLMDLSFSMNDDLQNIQGLGETLGVRMRQITRSFALGFGSFVDKPVSPFINPIQAVTNKVSCPDDCVPTYSFRNELRLNQNTTLFSDKVRNTRISTNEDEAEGTLDAIMQATVCKDHIGWRDDARRLLLITSDAPFHIEGDGKMAGILTPNDGKCHLDAEDSYQTSHLYDYPSIGQLNDTLVENNIITIFAISGETSLYRDLANIIQGANFARLTTDSNNIETIITDTYAAITGSIKMTYSKPEGIELSFSSNCTRLENSPYPLECSDIADGGEITFEVDVTATRCVNQTFTIYPIGFESRLTVHVSVMCNCSCELEPDYNSSYCSGGSGNEVCGICECLPGRYGDMCECTGENDEQQDQTAKDQFCKPDNSSSVLCSGRGECICGECRCHRSPEAGEEISGTYCECNNQACPLEDGEVCGGSERGECVCGLDQRTNECQCRPGYTGETCSCPTQTDTCRASNGRICNDQGDCTCGKCYCREGSKFSGPQCDECLTCTECDRYINCVKCVRFNTTDRPSEEECEACIYVIHNVTEQPRLNNTGSCSLSDLNNCSISFWHDSKETANGTINIYIKEKEDCPHSETSLIGLELHFLILLIVIGIILIGLLLIFIYRLYTWYLDRKEYQQFLAEKEKAQWEKTSNPIYKCGTRKYVNPMYGK